jgi:PAS domain S-box-containing protein
MNGKVRILIVEDEGIIAEATSKRLQKLGYIVTGIAASGEKALQKTKDDPPDLVLMDIKLSGKMTGIEAALLIRNAHQIPVVYLTAFADAETMEKIKSTESWSFLVKPFNDRELHETVETALYKHAMESRLKDSELRFSMLSRAAFEGIGISEMGIIIDANERLSDMLGYNHSEIVGMKADEIVALESRERVQKNTQSGFEGPFTHLALRKDGSTFPVEVQTKMLPYNGRTVLVIGIKEAGKQ